MAKLADHLERIARQTEAIAKEFVSIGDRVLSSISMMATIMVTVLGYGAKRAPQEANIGGYATVNAAHSNRPATAGPKSRQSYGDRSCGRHQVARKRPCCRALEVTGVQLLSVLRERVRAIGSQGCWMGAFWGMAERTRVNPIIPLRPNVRQLTLVRGVASGVINGSSCGHRACDRARRNIRTRAIEDPQRRI